MVHRGVEVEEFACVQEESYRVVHLVENPLELAFKQRLETLSQLEQENDRLKARVKVLEEFGYSQDVTAQVQLKLEQDACLPDRRSKWTTALPCVALCCVASLDIKHSLPQTWHIY